MTLDHLVSKRRIVMAEGIPNEDAYGKQKRFQFVRDFLEEFSPRRVLDVGCGTGEYLTVPLSKQFPQIQFRGLDIDVKSIEYAKREHNTENLTFFLMDEMDLSERFDVVIASEVIEHVENPKEYLRYLSEKLSPDGRIILTLPNGYGPFEFVTLITTLLDLTGILKILIGLKRRLRRNKTAVAASLGAETLAVSPHVNFFSYSTIRKLISSVALRIEHYQPRTFLCGFGFDQALHKRMIPWNARIADSLPAHINSGWMFVLRNGGDENEFDYRRGLTAKLRRYLNRKRAGLC